MEIYVGIDVSKKSFDVHITSLKKDKSFDYTRAKVKECVKWLASLKPVLVLMEATGGYEQALVAELFAASLPVKVMNPRRIRDFARARWLKQTKLTHVLSLILPRPFSLLLKRK